MKLTNNQIFALGAAGFAKLNYARLKPEDAISAYRLRRDIVRYNKEIDTARTELTMDAWEDKELFDRVVSYEQTKKGMEEAEYRLAIDDNLPKARKLLEEYGKEERDIATQPIAFESWLQLLKDNAFLSGFEETLADFIAEE